MKSVKLLFVLLSTLFVASCSNDFDEVQQANRSNQLQSQVEPRFVTENISSQDATNLITKFLNKTSFFYFQDVLGWDPGTYVYKGAFSVTYKGVKLNFRAIDCGITGKNGKYGVYADAPVTAVQFYNLEYPDIHGEIIYEENSKSVKAPVGVRYYYHTNCSDGNNNCWIVLEWDSAAAYENIIGY